MDTLGDDLVLLAIGPGGGRVRQADMLKYGVAGSELVRLAAKGLVTITGGRLAVAGEAATGNFELDMALNSIAHAKRPPTPKSWVAKPRRGILDEYLTKLEDAGR